MKVLPTNVCVTKGTLEMVLWNVKVGTCQITASLIKIKGIFNFKRMNILFCLIEEYEVNGDPHFIVTSHDEHHTKLCYDVNGKDGDVLVIIRDQGNSKCIGTKGRIIEVAKCNKVARPDGSSS